MCLKSAKQKPRRVRNRSPKIEASQKPKGVLSPDAIAPWFPARAREQRRHLQ